MKENDKNKYIVTFFHYKTKKNCNPQKIVIPLNGTETAHNQNTPYMDIETVKNNFFEIRRRKGLKWADLAAAAGMKSHTQLINFFSGSNMTLASLDKLAGLLGVQPYELLKPAADQDEAAQDQGAAAQIICPHCGKPVQIIVK